MFTGTAAENWHRRILCSPDEARFLKQNESEVEPRPPSYSSAEQPILKEQSDASLLPVFAQFVRVHALKVVSISALLLVPCWWHRSERALCRAQEMRWARFLGIKLGFKTGTLAT